MSTVTKRLWWRRPSPWGGLFFAVIIAMAGLLVLQAVANGRRAAEFHAEATSRNLALLLGSELHGTIDGIDVLLRGVLYEIERAKAKSGGLDTAAFDAYLARQQALAPQIISLRVTDPAGIVRYGPGVRDAPVTDVSDRVFFILQRDHADAGLVVAPPVLARISKQWAVPISRRISNPDGSFGGVVYVNIALANLSKTFSTINTGPQGVVALFDTQRHIVARYPEPDGPGSAVGLTIGSPQIVALMDAGRPEATYHAASSTDGVVRTYSYVKVGSHPLYLMVGLAEDDTLADWRSQRLAALGLYCAFTAVVLAISAMLFHAWRQRSRSLAALARANAELEAFSYVASHDLRQPLRTVVSYLGLIERRLDPTLLSDEIKEFIGFAVGGAKRMDGLILGLLEYSRTGRSGKTAPVALAEAVTDALSNLTVAIRETDAEIVVADGLPVIVCDRTELVRLFQNLIGNAVKYRAPERKPKIEIGWSRKGNMWLLSVKDNGIGIAPKDRERAFGIFQRLVPQDACEGTGIGLAICRKIVEHHGGRIWIESAPGVGTTFFFTLQKGSAST